MINGSPGAHVLLDVAGLDEDRANVVGANYPASVSQQAVLRIWL